MLLMMAVENAPAIAEALVERRPRRRHPGRGASATARCRGSAPCSRRSAPSPSGSRPSACARRRSSWSARWSRWPTRHTSPDGHPARRHRSRRPPARRLPRPARRRAAQGARGRARALPRRGGEGGAPSRRGRLPAALVPDGAALARRPRRRARPPPTRPATWSARRWPSRSPASTCTAGALASLERRPLPSLDEVLDGARSVLVLEDVVDHTNVGAIFRSGAALGLRRRAARPALRRPALPALGQGRDGRGLRAAVDPPARLVRRPAGPRGGAASPPWR